MIVWPHVRMKHFLSVILAAFAALLLAGCGENSTGSFQGYIEGEYVYVAAPLGGALTNLAVARGDSVKAGQRLFELERGAEAAALAVAEKNLASANASLALAESTFQRRRELRDSPSAVVSAEELDQARAQRDAAVAEVASQQAAVDKAQWSFDQKQQFAPANAFVQDTLYRGGEWVAAGSPVVVLLPPEMLPRIKTGENVSVTFDSAVKSYSATVNYISTQAEFTPPVLYNRENRAKLIFMVEAKFSPADAAELRPGQPVDVKISP